MDLILVNKEEDPTLHRHGWLYICDNIIQPMVIERSSPLILDLYADKTFNWKNTNVKLPYTQNWIGICHHTFDTEFSSNNLYSLINNVYFKESIPFCKGLIVLSEYLKRQLITELIKINIDIPVFSLVHPTKLDVPQFDFNKFSKNKNKKLVHIGAWMRNIFFFYNLTLTKYELKSKCFLHFTEKETLQKVALKGTGMEDYFYSEDFLNELRMINPKKNKKTIAMCRRDCDFDPLFNRWYSQFNNFIMSLKDSVELLNRQTNEEYDELLTENIVFINLIDASAVNTLLECVARNTPIVVNKHPSVIEILGDNYPLYYNKDCENGISSNYYLMNREIEILLSKRGIIKRANDYLVNLDKSDIHIDTFKKNLYKICKNVN